MKKYVKRFLLQLDSALRRWNISFSLYGRATRIFDTLRSLGTWLYWGFYTLFIRDLPSVNLPSSRSVRLRLLFLRPFFRCCGSMVNIQPHVVLEHAENITIGDFSGIGAHSRVSAHAPVSIGSHVMIAPELVILTSNHETARNSIMMLQGSIEKAVSIGNDVWIGTRVTILPGVSIADGCVIAAGAVVTKNTEPYGIYGGVPARKIRDR